MTVKEYIESQLNGLNSTPEISGPQIERDVVDVIYKSLTSKKFRKYSLDEASSGHIRRAIEMQIQKNEPINIVYPHGAYKLWRLDEAPEVDWAELFSLIYYSKWVKEVCQAYKPGVWFDFFVDDYIVNRTNNIPMADIEAYIQSYQRLIDFLKPYQPSNLTMTITTVGSRFTSEAAFDESLRKNIEVTPLTEITDNERASVELNVRVTTEQAEDEKWREKSIQMHNAYSITKSEPKYHRAPEKILAFTQRLPVAIALGTTKDSIMKFWIGAGVLKPRDDGYRQLILSPHQLSQTNFQWEDISLGLNDKNFHKIRVVDE